MTAISAAQRTTYRAGIAAARNVLAAIRRDQWPEMTARREVDRVFGGRP